VHQGNVAAADYWILSHKKEPQGALPTVNEQATMGFPLITVKYFCLK
jgi:hypothetical protein